MINLHTTSDMAGLLWPFFIPLLLLKSKEKRDISPQVSLDRFIYFGDISELDKKATFFGNAIFLATLFPATRIFTRVFKMGINAIFPVYDIYTILIPYIIICLFFWIHDRIIKV